MESERFAHASLRKAVETETLNWDSQILHLHLLHHRALIKGQVKRAEKAQWI